eukprot:TRINITY_DN6717_c0_g1_i1.p1 TRINITY_DN6717_c0_g1~~TRINITY_DN6717_c0_g1_i1.p1  ORF type:complete len:296 (-),score=36.74 TRINITY_DN6717_c0_g1_i1:366-1253(-)
MPQSARPSRGGYERGDRTYMRKARSFASLTSSSESSSPRKAFQAEATLASKPTSPGIIGDSGYVRPQEPHAAGDYRLAGRRLEQAQREPALFHRVTSPKVLASPDPTHPLENPEADVDRRWVRSIAGYAGFIPARQSESVHGMSHSSLTRKSAGLVENGRFEKPQSCTSATFNHSCHETEDPDKMDHVVGYTGHIPRVGDEAFGVTHDAFRHESKRVFRTRRKVLEMADDVRQRKGVQSTSNTWMGNQGHYNRPGSAWKENVDDDPLCGIHTQAIQATLEDRELKKVLARGPMPW